MKKGIPREEALRYHRKLPKRLWRYLRRQGFADELIHRKLLGFDGTRITVPVFDQERELIFFEYLSDPEKGPVEVVDHTRSFDAFLYGFDTLETRPHRVILVKGVWDRLVLLSRGIPAAGIVGDPGSFLDVWSGAFQGMEIVIVFPRTGRSYRDARALSELLGAAPVSELPFIMSAYPQAHQTVASFFLYHQGTRTDFLRLLPPSEQEGKKNTS